MSVRPLLLALLLIAAVLPASAAAGWKPAVNLSPAGYDSSGPDVAMAPSGKTVVAWRQFDGTQPPFTCCSIVEARIRPRGGKFGKAIHLSAPGQNAGSPQVSIGSDGTIAVIWTRFDGTIPPFTCCTIAQVRVRPPGSGFGPVQNLSLGGEDAQDVDVAVGRRGRAVAIWTREEGPGLRRLQARFRAPGKGSAPSFVGLQNLSKSGDPAYEPALAMSDSGRAIVIWQRYDGVSDRIVARTRAPGKHFAGGLANLSPAGEDADYPSAVVGPNGRSVVSYVVEQDATANYKLQVRMRAAHGKFGAIRQLSNESGSQYAAPGIDRAGRVTIVWEQRIGDAYTRIFARTARRGHGFGKAQRLSAVNVPAQNPVLAIGTDGRAFALWQMSDESSSLCCLLAQAAIRPPGKGRFGTRHTLSLTGAGADSPRLAAGPAGTAAAVWTRYDGADGRAQFAGFRR